MKRNAVRRCSRLLCLFISIPALAQTASVQATSRDAAAEIKKEPEEQAKRDKHSANIQGVEEKLKTAGEMMGAQPPRYDQAIRILTEATQMAPDQDVVWYRLGVAQLKSANVQADAAEKAKRSSQAYKDLGKAIDVFQAGKAQAAEANSLRLPCSIQGVCTHVEARKTGATSDNHKLAVYYSNLGDAAARLGKNAEAVKDFQQAAQLDLAYAGTYYFDLGILLRNTAKTTEERKHAVEAFDKAIAADPDQAAAYYLKGEVLFGMSTTDDTGKIIPPPGTLEALEKYLELQPNGPYAEPAKRFLAALNAAVESGYGVKTGTNTKK